MSDSQPFFRAGDFWWFAEPGTPGHALSIHELLSQACEDARAVLRGAGHDTPDLIGGSNLARLRGRLERGSLEEVALGVLVAALRCMPLLDRAKPSAKSLLRWAEYEDDLSALAARTDATWGAMVDECSIAVASFAMRYAVFVSMAGGLTDSARVGRRAQAQRAQAARSSAEVSRNHDWRSDANRLWAEHPSWTLNRVANSIAVSRSTPTQLVDKRSVIRAIRDLVPSTSPSFKAE